MINLSIQNFILFFCPTFVPSGLGSLKEKGRLKASRTLWSSPRYSLLHATDPLPVCRKRLQPPRPSWVSKGRLKDFLIREEGNVETKEKPSKKQYVCLFSRAGFFATPWTVAHQVPLSMEFSRQEYWSRLPFPYSRGSFRPRDQPMSPALADGFFTTCHLRSPSRNNVQQFNRVLVPPQGLHVPIWYIGLSCSVGTKAPTLGLSSQSWIWTDLQAGSKPSLFHCTTLSLLSVSPTKCMREEARRA